jgi:hypothetical protein
MTANGQELAPDPATRDPRNRVVRWLERVRAGEIWGGPG